MLQKLLLLGVELQSVDLQYEVMEICESTSFLFGGKLIVSSGFRRKLLVSLILKI
jgi:hypothetical protein